ncbi:MAG: GAF domain-containing protein, partial [Anaerolineales bacterium]|nr:GAF domain-containing protein [Anaerolineales bacterium]
MASETVIAKPKEGHKSRAGLRIFKPALRLRLLLIIISASMIIVLVSTILLLNYQRRQLIETATSTTTTISNAIKANLKHAMLTGDGELVNESVQAVVAEQSVDVLRILNDQGLVSASSVDGEIGRLYTQEEAACQICHASNPESRNESVVFRANDGRQMLLNVNLIHNPPECQACHNPENQILGLMMIESSLTELNEQLTTGFWRTILVALTAFALLVGLIVPALNRYVVQPVEELSKGVAEIGAGNLNYRVPVTSQDELGELAESFNNMRQQLNISRAEMERSEQELASLNEIGRAATQLLDLQQILELAVDTMVNKLGMAVAQIYLPDEDTGRYILRTSQGISQTQIEEIDRRRQSGWDITQEVVDTGKEVFVANMAEDTRFHGVWDELQGRSYLKLPLMSRGTVVGVLGMVTQIGHSLTLREVEFLKAVGWEIGIAIDNAILLANTRQREQQAITLYKLGTNISASLALSSVLGAVVEASRDLLDADIGLVGIADEACQEVVIKAAAGVQTNVLKGARIEVSESSPWSPLLEGQPILVLGDTQDLSRFHDAKFIAAEGITSMLAVPLLRGGYFLGLIEVMRRQGQRFRTHDAQLLLRLAHQVVVSIENAQLYRQLHHMAALEERDRLAREMHDHLSQGLGYLKVRASITDDLLSSGQIDQAQESLLELKKTTQFLYTDVREDIFNLRTVVTERVGFFSTLQDYLADYKIHYGLSVYLVIDDEFSSEFSEEVASQLLRIIQEALSNVRRHSDASQVIIQCLVEGDQVCISIADNGRGFYPAQVAKEGKQRYG